MRALILVLATFVLVSLSIACLASGRLSDLGLNLFAESIGIVATVFVVDILLKRESERRSAPQQLCAYRDIRALLESAVRLYQMLYMAGSGGRRPRSTDDLFREQSYHMYMSRVMIDAPAPVVPQRSWLDFFRAQCADLRGRSSQIMDRYSDVLDPSAYELIHRIHDETWDPGELGAVVDEARRAGSRQFTSMDSLLAFPARWAESLSALCVWAEAERARLGRLIGLTDRPVIEVMFPNDGSTP